MRGSCIVMFRKQWSSEVALQYVVVSEVEPQHVLVRIFN